MSLIDRYIFRSLFFTCLVVILVLLFLNGLFGFIDELDSLKPGYEAANAFIYTLYKLPRSIINYIAMTTMIGCLVGMGMLANHSELTVMRAAGIAKWRILLAVFKPVTLIIVCVMLLNEFVAPRLDQAAEVYKIEKTKVQAVLGGDAGLWHRDGDHYLNIAVVQRDGVLLGVTYHRFGDNNQLVEAGYAETAVFEDSAWWLKNVSLTLFTEERTETLKTAKKRWDVSLDPELLSVLAEDPDNMSISGLRRYSHYLQEQSINASSYVIAFWQKLLLPFAVLGLVLIAMSTLFGPMRSVSMGQRIMVGFMVGILFKIIQDVLGPATMVYNLSPFFAALTPVLLCLGVGGWMLKKAG